MASGPQEVKPTPELFHALIENSSEGVMLISEAGIILYETDSSTRICGRPVHERIGARADQFVHPSDAMAFGQWFGKVCATPATPLTAQFRYQRADGVWVMLEVTANNQLKNPAINGIVANIRDITEREHVQQALRETEMDFKSILDYSQESILILDPETHIITVNAATEELTGYTSEELKGKPIDITYVPQDRPLFAQRLARFKTEKRLTLERPLQRKDGAVRTVEILVTQLPDGRVLEFIRDITERKNKSDELKVSEQRFRALVENAPDAIVIFDVTNGHFADVNERAIRLFGMSRDELLQTGPVQISPEKQPDGRPSSDAAQEYIQQALDGGIPVFEWIHRAKDGHEIPCEIRLLELPGDGTNRFIRGSILDISERKKASKALEAQQAFNKALAENSLDVIAVLNPDGTVKYESPRDEPSFGYVTGELKGKNAFDLIHPDDLPAVQETFQKVMAGTERQTVAFRFHAKDGSWIFVQALAINLSDNPYVQGALVSMRDLTELKKAQEEAGRSDELERMNKLMIGREMRIAELKGEIKKLKGE